MKQVFRRVIDRRGRVSILELPVPHLGPDQVLVQGRYSLISSGTETGTVSKTAMELVKQTISDPWMRHVVKQTVFATGLSQTNALDSLREEIRYRVELCPCTTVDDSFVELDVVSGL